MLSRLKSLGPGLLYAGAAIGVSHLVQSTRAGAEYGYILIIAIILAHLFKYPFFALGPKYATETGESLIAGLAQLGKWAVVLVAFITIGTMFTVQAAVTIVTAGLVQKITGLEVSAPVLSACILAVCFAILQVGKFKVLDNLMKVIMVILSITTLIAFIFSFGIDKEVLPDPKIFRLSNAEDVSFLLAFVGWMPAPLDIAIWHSIWVIASPHKSSSQFDFRVGFYGTAILGICFLTLGANALYGTQIELQSSALGFSSQLIDIFTSAIGSWAYWLVAIAAFTTMFSTTLTCFDAMPRVMNEIGKFTTAKWKESLTVWRVILAFGALIILFYLVGNMKEMVMFATIISFLTAPVLASLCLVMVHKNSKVLQLWSETEKWLARIGVIVLFLLSILYVINIF